MYLFNRAGYNAYMMRDKEEQMDTEMNTDPGYYYTMKDDICLDTKDEAYPFTRYRYLVSSGVVKMRTYKAFYTAI